MAVLVVLPVILLPLTNADDSQLYNFQDLPTKWTPTGTCYNLWNDCLYAADRGGINGGDVTCQQCLTDCRATAEDYSVEDIPAPSYTPDHDCGDIDRSDCERAKLLCEKRCNENVEQCTYQDAVQDIACTQCHDYCESYWFEQCKLKRNYDLNDGTFDATSCADFTKWPEPDRGEACCRTIVYAGSDSLEECKNVVYDACMEGYYALLMEGEWDAADVREQQCDCYFGFTVREREECEAIGQSSAKSIDPPLHHVGRESSAKRRVTHQAATAPIAQDVAPTSLYLLGAFIAAMLACIAAVLCFAICVQPLWRQMGLAQKKQYELVEHVDEQL